MARCSTTLIWDWNPNGHPPPGIYTVPHYDIHFFLLTETQASTIDSSNLSLATVPPATATIPAGYVMDPLAVVPHEGVHFENHAAKEWHGQPFDSTLIFGFYNGQLDFIEPMVTQVMLGSSPSFTGPVNQPAQYPSGAGFPTQYSVTTNPQTGETEVSLDGLVSHV